MRFFLTSFFLLYCWQAALFGQYDMYYCVPSGGNVDVYLDSDYNYCPSGQRITVIDSATGTTRLAGSFCNFGGTCLLSNTCPLSPANFNISTSPSTWTITSTLCKDGDTYMRPNAPASNTSVTPQPSTPQARIPATGNCFNTVNPPPYTYRFLPPPVINISSNAGNPICVGSSTVLTADCIGSDICLYQQSYLWSNGATTASITIAPGAPGITSYFVTVSQPGFTTPCSIVASYDVTTTASSAIVEINGNSSASVTLTSCTFPYNIVANCTNCGGGQTYQWAGSGGFFGNANFVTLNGSGGGSLTVTENGCQVVKNINLNVGASPTVTITPNTSTTCVGATAPVVSSAVGNCAGCSYAWNSGETTSNVNISTASGQGFLRIVTVTNASGCVGTSNSTSVVVNDPPNVTLSATSVCNGDTTNLPVVTSNCGGGCSYNWTNGLSGANPSVNPSSLTSYTVTVTNSYGCERIVPATVTVNDVPTIAFPGGSNVTICSGSNILVGISVPSPGRLPISYLWSNGSTFDDMGTLKGAGTYSVTVTNGHGCQASATKTITESTGITPTFNPSSLALCPTGASTKPLQVGVYNSYLWSNGATTQGINVSSAGNYTVTVTSGGCTGTNSINVGMITPSAFIGIVASVNPVVGGNSTVISTSDPSYATYAWASGQATQSITVTPGSTTTYTLTVTDANGCTGMDALEITVTGASVPVVNTTPTLSICTGATANFGVTCTSNCASATYLWSTGATTSTVNASPTVNTNYTVTVTNGSGGTITSNVSVNVYPSVTASVSTTPNPVTTGNAVAVSCNTISGASYTWSTGQTTSSFSVTPTVNTIYAVTISNPGCQANNQREVTVSSPSAPVLTVSSASICPGSVANFGVTCISNCTGATYAWSNGITTNTASATASPASSTNYTVTVTNSSSGVSVATVSVTVYASPVITFSGGASTTICAGNVATISITNNPAGATFLWSNAATTQSITANTSGTHALTFTTANGCQNIASHTLTVNPSVTASVSITPNPVVTGNAVAVSCNTITGASYTWSTGQTNSSFSVTPTVNTTYTVTITSNGCQGSGSGTVTVNTASAPTITVSKTPSVTAVCAGTVVTLQAGCTAGCTGISYVWSNGATTANTTVSPNSTTTYTVTATNSGSLTATGSLTVTTLARPTISIASTNPTNFCANQYFTITTGSVTGGTTPYTYAWSTSGATTANLTGLAGIAGTSVLYTVSVTSANGCVGTAGVARTPTGCNSGPRKVSILPNDTVCTGYPVTIAVDNPLSNPGFTWSTGQTGVAAITVFPTTTTTYTVTVTTSNNPDTIISRTITVSPSTVGLSLSQPYFCTTGQTASLSITSAVCTYCQVQLYNSNGSTRGSLITGLPTTRTLTVADTGAFYAKIVGCDNNVSNVLNLGLASISPSIVVVPDTALCGGSDSATLIVSVPSNTSLVWSNGRTSSIITLGTSGTYTVTATNNSTGCTGTASRTLTSVTGLNTNFNTARRGSTRPLRYCGSDIPDTLIPVLNHPNSLFYINNQLIANRVLNPAAYAANTTHTIRHTIYDASTGCLSAQTDTFRINPNPVANFGSLAGSYCVNHPSNITVTVNPSGGTLGLNSRTTGNIVIANNYVLAPSILTDTVRSDTFRFSYSFIDGNGCGATSSISTIIHPKPLVSMSPLGSNYCADPSIVVALNPNPSPASAASFSINVGGTAVSNFTIAGSASTFRPSAAGSATITYTYTSAFTNCTNVYTDATNISGTSTATLYQVEMPNVGGSICLTDSVFMVTATRDVPAAPGAVSFYSNGNTASAGIVGTGFMGGSPIVWVDTAWIKVNEAFFRQDTILPFVLTYSLNDGTCSKVFQRDYTLRPLPNLATNRPAYVCDFSKTQIDVRDLTGASALPINSSQYTVVGQGFYKPNPFTLEFITDSLPDSTRIRKHAFQITYTAPSGCTGYLRDSVEIKANPRPDIVGLNSVYCASGNVDTIFGVPSNGNWWVPPPYSTSFPDSTLARSFIIINPNTIGTVPLWYKVAYGNGCVNKVTDSVRVTNTLAIQIRNPASGFTSYCQNTPMIPLVITNQNNTRLIEGLQISLKNTAPPYNTLAGGIVSDTFINPAADTSSSGSATYRIYAVYADASSGCSDLDTTTLVQIQAAPILRLSLANAVQGRYYCMSPDSAAVTVNSINGIAFTGAFSLSSNLSNISSTTANPASVYLSTARVDTVKYIGGVGSINNCADTAIAVIEVRTPPNSLSINGLRNRYCQRNDELNIGSLPTNGVSTTVPGLRTTIGVTEIFELPNTSTAVLTSDDSIQNRGLSSFAVGNYLINYKYTDEFGCVNNKTDSFKISPNPIASFVSTGTCEGDSLTLVSTSNFGGAAGNNSIVTWGWTINQVLMPNNDTVSTLASDAGLYQCGLTVTSNQSCQSDTLINIPIIKYPKVDFQAFGGCQGDTVTFVVASTELRSTDTLTQYAWDFGDGSPIRQAVRVGNDSIAPQSYVYSIVGAFTPRLVLTNRNACTERDSLRLVVAPVYTLQQVIPQPPYNPLVLQTPYSNSFEQANRIDWFPAQDTAESEWHWGWAGTLNGSEFIHTRQPNNPHQRILTTALGVSGVDSVTMFSNFDGRKSSWLYSPCFDFTNSQRPMIKFDYTSDMRRLVTGAGLEFFNEQTGFWERLGENGNGVNWYNSTDVIGLFELPDTDIDNVPNNELHGWSDTSRWQTARYRLDQFRGKRNVRFRIVFSSIVPNTPNLGAIRSGFGFDNVWVGERQRSVLVEHFANVNHPNMEAINMHVYRKVFSNLNFRDVSLIQYHTGDNYNVQTSVSAREGLYNTQNNPNRYALNGFTTPNRLSTQLTAQELELEMLQDPTFVLNSMNQDTTDKELKLFVDIPAQTVRVKAELKAVANLPNQLYNVYPVITEHFVDDQIADTMMGVFRAFLPINTGIPFRKAWTIGETAIIDQTWTINQNMGINVSHLAGVIFIQEDTLTKKVHQAVSTLNLDVRVVTSVLNPQANNAAQQENMFSLNLFPNPAQEQAFLRFDQPLAQDASFQVWDMAGKQLSKGFIRAGESEARIETIDFASGMYVITVRDQSNSVFVQRKLVVVRP